MRVLDRLLSLVNLQRRDLQDAGSPRNPSYWLIKALGGGPSATGLSVNESNAPSWTPIMSGMRFLSETMAALPFGVFQRMGERGKKPLADHPIARLARHGPNPEQDWFQFMELMQGHAVLWGNAYAGVVWNGMGEPVQLWPYNPDRVQLRRDRNGQLYYQVSIPANESTNGGVAPVAAENMLHIRGFSRWGLLGERMSQIHREAIGLGLATEEFAARFFGQGANPSGFLEHPAELTEDSYKRLRDSIESQVVGMDKSHRALILEEGMKWHQMSVDPEKAQFLGLRQFQIQEASRILRIPPHLLYDLSRATFTNIEHQGIEVVIYTLLPWARRWESRLNKTLVSEKMKNVVYTKFKLEGLLRGDSAARAAFYASGRQQGWLSANDIRELEDMNPVTDGDTYLQPVNMVPLGTEPAPPVLPAPPPDDEDEEEDKQDRAQRERHVRALELIAVREPPVINAPAPIVTVSPPSVTVAAPTVTVHPSPITVEAPVVHVPQPNITVQPVIEGEHDLLASLDERMKALDQKIDAIKVRKKKPKKVTIRDAKGAILRSASIEGDD